MRTIKEQIAPLFQQLGRLRRDRRYYEACSAPWFVFDFGTHGVAAGVPFDQIKLPFKKMVLVIQVAPNTIPVYLETEDAGLRGAAVFLSGLWICWRGDRITATSIGISLDFAEHTRLAIMTSIMAFSRMVQDPAVHVARVCPVNAMRSIEWTKAQEHHVLLHRSHPANTPGAVSGAGPADYDETTVLKRMAHRVRAHFRVLKAPRFKHKRGQVVPVREQWRGPKHWVNKRSRQSYRWVDKSTFGL